YRIGALADGRAAVDPARYAEAAGIAWCDYRFHRGGVLGPAGRRYGRRRALGRPADAVGRDLLGDRLVLLTVLGSADRFAGGNGVSDGAGRNRGRRNGAGTRRRRTTPRRGATTAHLACVRLSCLR